MDVEGYEEILLLPEKIPYLKKCHILFESHDILSPGIGGNIIRRFLDTHNTFEINARYRTGNDLTFLSPLIKYYIKYNILGHTIERPDKPERMRWFYLEPKNSN